MLVGVLATIFASVIAGSAENSCLRKPFCRSATKTPYDCIVKSATPADEVKFAGGCSAKSVWMLTRHGTRYPSKKGIQYIRESLPTLLASRSDGGSLCEEAIEAMQNWDHGLSDDTVEKTLHPQGQIEMQGIAERMQMRFPHLLDNGYEAGALRFRSTATERARQSQLHFAAGLFGRNVADKVDFEPVVEPHDPLIRFYKVCDKWRVEVKRNKTALAEMAAFEESEHLIRVRQAVSKKLGLAQPVTAEELEAAYVACVFGQAWQPARTSPWCSLFNGSDLAAMEYREDLEAYWREGYGYPVTSEQACVLMRDLMRAFDEERPVRNGTFYFSHSGAILKFSAYLGLFRDQEVLRHDNYASSGNRTYKTTENDAFGSNVAFVLQECGAQKTRKIGMYFNERLIPIPGCDNADLWCDYDAFKRLYNVDQCDFDSICRLDRPSDMDSVGDEPVDEEDKF